MDKAYQTKLLWSILVSSLNENAFLSEGLRFPSNGKYILSEFVNGTIDFLGKKSGEIDYKTMNFNKKETFENLIWKSFFKSLAGNGEKLDFAIKEVFWKWAETPELFYSSWRDFREDVSDRLTFSPSVERVVYTNKKIIPFFSEFGRDNIKRIGKEMRKYTHEDLEFIKRAY